MYDLVNIFEVFLPQLLLYPNPKDPLNVDAAKLMGESDENYQQKIRDYVKKYAVTEEVVEKKEEEEEEKKESESELSETSQLEIPKSDDENEDQ